MRNFNYNVANLTTFEGYRVIALKNDDMERLANAANMKEPEISVTPETVVESQPYVQEAPVQSISESSNVNNQPNSSSAQVESQVIQQETSAIPTVDNQTVAPHNPGDNNVLTQESTRINSSSVNIPDPVAMQQQNDSIGQIPETQIQPDTNIFDAPEVRMQNPVQETVTQVTPSNSTIIDLDEYMIRNQAIYEKAKKEIEESLIKVQREQMDLVIQMMKNLEQLKLDNATYSSAIDEIVNEEGFKKVA